MSVSVHKLSVFCRAPSNYICLNFFGSKKRRNKGFFWNEMIKKKVNLKKKWWIQNPSFFSISSGLHASSFPLEINITSLHIKQHMLWNYPWVQTEFQWNIQFTCDYLQTHFKPPEGEELCNGTRQQVPWNLPGWVAQETMVCYTKLHFLRKSS
jgi:hypothetical protein